MLYRVLTEVLSADKLTEGVKDAAFPLLNRVLSSLQSMFRRCERDH